ncbi:MAG: RNA polymerase sigma-70 factor [Chitinophagaceae bacterium]
MPPEKENIQYLAQSFQRGEEQGFNHFFNTLYPGLLFYAYRMINDKVAAEDIVEESFIKIWERHTTFHHHRLIKSWMYTTVRHACIDWHRQLKVTQEKEQEMAHLQKNNTETYAIQEMIRAEVASEIYNAINDLPPRCQQVFKLLFIEGKTLKQAADEMKLSIHTIKNQRARGLTILKKRAPDFYLVICAAVLLT